jgi:hypothetical protein
MTATLIKYHNSENRIIAELIDNEFIINQSQHVLDILGELGEHNCGRIIIHEKNFHKDFFNLRTGLAGEILQKFSNYRIRLAIVGDFSKYSSKSLQDYIRESNKGQIVFFTENVESAIKRLTMK